MPRTLISKMLCVPDVFQIKIDASIELIDRGYTHHIRQGFLIVPIDVNPP
jgi:hypothetical protein